MKKMEGNAKKWTEMDRNGPEIYRNEQKWSIMVNNVIAILDRNGPIFGIL
jgi:hypothetical protein